MDFLCDVHIPIKLAKFLSGLGHNAIHVNSLPQKWHSTDHEICRVADKQNLIVITKDEDFRNSFLLRQTPKKLIRIALGNISNQMLIELFDRNLQIIAKLSDEQAFYLELGDSAIVYTL